jgi:hypothetical protein
MQPKNSLSCSQKPVTGFCPEPVCLLIVDFLLDLLFDREDGGYMFFWNIYAYSESHYMYNRENSIFHGHSHDNLQWNMAGML